MLKYVTGGLLALTLAVFATGAVSTEAETAPPSQQQTTTTAAKPVVVSTKYVRPKRILHIRTGFTPWAEPSQSQVYKIIDIEAAKAGVSASGLSNRIRCESGYRWYAENGQYHGLGQFAHSTFERGLSTIGSRVVKYVTTRVRVRRVLRVRTFSDGRVERVRRWRIHQRIIHLHAGLLPRHPEWTHGWAQVRIMAQAIAGRSAVNNSEWECST